jgi:hypothetical protein
MLCAGVRAVTSGAGLFSQQCVLCISDHASLVHA